MPYKPRPFDYEPVTRRSPGWPDEPEDEEGFNVSRRMAQRADAADELTPDHNFYKPRGEDQTPAVAVVDSAHADTRTRRHESRTLRRGHTLSFFGLLLFTVVLYFRPYELFDALSSLTTLAFWIAFSTLLIFIPSQLGLEGNLTTRPREVNLVLLLSLAALLCLPLAIDTGEAWDKYVEFIKVILMFIVMVNVVRTERRLKILLFLALAVGCIVSAGAINDYRLGHFVIAGERIAGIIGGMFANSNDMALHLVMMTPLSIALFFSTRNIFKKALFGAAAALMVVGNVVTFSRGGLLGLLGALAVLFWKLGRRHRLLVFLLAISIMLSLIVFMPGTMIERIASIFNPTDDVSGGASAISRRALLFRSILVMIRHPLLGIGMGNFHFVSLHEQVSHNAYTQVGAEIGIPAMLLYIAFIVTAFKRVRGIEREMLATESHTRFYYLAVGLQASLVGYMITTFFISVAYQHYLYYLVGYAICLHRIYEASQRPVIPDKAVETSSRTRTKTGRRRHWRVPLQEM